MAALTFHFIKLDGDITGAAFLSVLKKLPANSRPWFVGKCHHWVHEPHLSIPTLLEHDNQIKNWSYLLISQGQNADPLKLPDDVESISVDQWSITASVDNEEPSSYHQRRKNQLAAPPARLPDGWSPSDTSALDAAIVPEDLEASLGMSSYSLGARKQAGAKPVDFKNFVKDFGKRHTGPIAMMNLLAYLPEQRPRYFEYIAAFRASVGSDYGADPTFFGPGVIDWSSRRADVDEHGKGGWEDMALVHYPSIWHFAAMLDSAEYMDADRRFKQNVILSNCILAVSEVDVDYTN